MLFEASIKDQVLIKDVRDLLGERQFHARLLDETGRKELASCDGEVTLDDKLPSRCWSDGPRSDHAGTTRELKVRATVAPPPSRIKEVALIFGRKADFDKAVADNRSFKAKPEDAQGREWSATLPVPPDAPANLVVTARFTTGVGLKDFAYQEVAVVDPPSPDGHEGGRRRRQPRRHHRDREGRGPAPARLERSCCSIPCSMPGKRARARLQETDEKGALLPSPNLEPKLYQIFCISRTESTTGR